MGSVWLPTAASLVVLDEFYFPLIVFVCIAEVSPWAQGSREYI